MIQFSSVHNYKYIDKSLQTARGDGLLAEVREKAKQVKGARIIIDNDKVVRVQVPNNQDHQFISLWEDNKDINGVAGTHPYIGYANTKKSDAYYGPF